MIRHRVSLGRHLAPPSWSLASVSSCLPSMVGCYRKHSLLFMAERLKLSFHPISLSRESSAFFHSFSLFILSVCLASLFNIRSHRYIALLFSLDNRNPFSILRSTIPRTLRLGPPAAYLIRCPRRPLPVTTTGQHLPPTLL
jgi:hypothetical protein